MQKKIRARHLLPLLVLGGVTAVGLITTAASGSTVPSSPSSNSTTRSPSQSLPTSGRRSKAPPIVYVVPNSKSDIKAGEVLFEANCSSCHGPAAAGTGVAPPLLGLGPATVSFWVSTGRMPLATANAEAIRKPPRFPPYQQKQIVAFVSSLAPTSPAYPPGIPLVNTKSASLPTGNSLFVLNCAGCHTITGSGDALANGAFAPSLHKATATQVAEAIRTGPGNMPFFGPGNLSNQQVADIVAYVKGPIQHPNNRGGLALGGIGPVAEGFIALLIGVGACMLIAFWIGDRA